MWAQARDLQTPADRRIGVGASLPVSYWRDWVRRDPAATMHKLAVPTLVTRGTKDINAGRADFELLRAAATAPGSASKEFDGLSHIYMPVAGEPTGREVMTPGTVSPEFLDYLAAWIKARAAAK